MLRTNLIIFILCGAIVLFKLAASPSEQTNAIWAGYSFPRLVIHFFIVSVLLIAFWLLKKTFQHGVNIWGKRIGLFLSTIVEKKAPHIVFSLLGITYITISTSPTILGKLAPYQERLLPILWWIFLAALQLLISHLITKSKKALRFSIGHKQIINAVTIWGGLVLISLTTATIKTGIKPDVVYWQEAGTPILFWQVLLVTPLVFLTYSAAKNLFNNKSANQYISLALFILAIIAWGAVNPKPSYNALPPRAPNYESYPFADAIIYDTNAQSFLIGQPIANDFWQKPFYSFFLALLHILVKQDYSLLQQLHLAILAIIPTLVFLLTQKLTNRSTGILAAILVIIREVNALSLANTIQVSHTKLLMSDVFSMGFMVLLTLLVTTWLENPAKHRLVPVIIGGTLGFFSLTRGHVILLFPVILLMVLVFFRNKNQLHQLKKGAGFILLGFAIPLVLWSIQVFQQTGSIGIQAEISPYTAQAARLYSFNPFENPTRYPNENDVEYFGRIKDTPIEFTLNNPQEVAKFTSAHFMHNAIFSVVYLPGSLEIESARTYVKRTSFWKNWQGEISIETGIFLITNLFILALGASASIKKSNYLLLVPLLLGMSYNLTVSLGRLSGWRFIMPVDWITLVFYAAGIAEIISFLQATFFKKENDALLLKNLGNEKTYPLEWSKLTRTMLAIFTIGLIFTQGYRVFPTRYPEKTQNEILEHYRKSSPEKQQEISLVEIEAFLSQDRAVAIYGRGLYPSYIPANKGSLNHFYLEFSPQPYNRLVFHVIGPEETGVILPQTTLTKNFPNGADVIVFGCIEEKSPEVPVSTWPGYIDALLVLVEGDGKAVVYVRDSVEDLVCPLTTISQDN